MGVHLIISINVNMSAQAEIIVNMLQEMKNKYVPFFGRT